MKVAVVGLSPTTHDKAPWGDPDWQVWGLPWDVKGWPYMDRHFEMHDFRLLDSKHSKRSADYWQRLHDCQRLYVQQETLTLPTAIEYPFEAVAQSIGQAYWNSSIAYALALAIHERADEIAIFGVDMSADDEYGYQRPNMEYLIGVARGKGIKVSIPDESPLCKFQGKGIRFYDHLPTYQNRYGWLG